MGYARMTVLLAVRGLLLLAASTRGMRFGCVGEIPAAPMCMVDAIGFLFGYLVFVFAFQTDVISHTSSNPVSSTASLGGDLESLRLLGSHI